jgi:hypothetical protein
MTPRLWSRLRATIAGAVQIATVRDAKIGGSWSDWVTAVIKSGFTALF